MSERFVYLQISDKICKFDSRAKGLETYSLRKKKKRDRKEGIAA